MKRFSKAFALGISALTALSLSVNSFARSDNNDEYLIRESTIEEAEDLTGFTLVSEEESIIDDYYVVDRTYVESKPTLYSANISGSKTVKKSRTLYSDGSSSGDLIGIMWASGDFSYNKDKDSATIKNAKGWFDDSYFPSKFKLKEYPLSYDSNHGATTLGGLFGYNYAYVEYKISITNLVGVSHDFRLWIDVNVIGEVHCYT